jgi:hypothetical protein
MKIRGTVGKTDLEGGYFTFEAGGHTYKLEGGGKDLLKPGVKAEVEGSVDEGAMGIGFGQKVLKVKSYTIG